MNMAAARFHDIDILFVIDVGNNDQTTLLMWFMDDLIILVQHCLLWDIQLVRSAQ